MFDDKIKLIKEHITYDELGNEQVLNIVNEVFATIKSVSQNEFYKAGEAGIKASLVVEMNAYEYESQKKVRLTLHSYTWNGSMPTFLENEYQVYRTYRKSKDIVELYLTDKVSTKYQNEY